MDLVSEYKVKLICGSPTEMSNEFLSGAIRKLNALSDCAIPNSSCSSQERMITTHRHY